MTLSLFLILKSLLRLRLSRFLFQFQFLSPALLALMEPLALLVPPVLKAPPVLKVPPVPRVLRVPLPLSNSYSLTIVRDHNELFFREEKFSNL
ncbi:MAG: hypothetical protein ABIT92_04755 [Gammaproteobacteria bacterium]